MDPANVKLVLLEMMLPDVVSPPSSEDPSIKASWLVWTAKRLMLVMKLKPREVF